MPDRRSLSLWIAIICLCGPALSGRLEAITWTVSNLPGRNCSDAGSGTILTPFCSIQKGVDRAQPGDTVVVAGGVYGPAQLNVAASGTATARIAIRAVPARSAVIIGPQGAGDAAGAGVLITGSHMTFEGFEVRNAAGTGIRNWGNHVTIRNNFVHDNARGCDPSITPKCGQGIASNGTSPRVGVIIENNLSYRNGSSSSQDHNFYVSNPGAIIRNNASVAASGFGFQIYPNCDGCLVYNNIAYGNLRNSGYLIGGDGSASFSSNVKIYNNISMGNAGYGFWIYRNGSEPISMRCNIVYGNTAGTLKLLNSTAPDNVNFYQADPLLANPAGLDFHLRPGSPAIDRGNAGLVPPDDIDGDPRIMGAAVDIGVDEFRSQPPPEVAIDLSFLGQKTLAWSPSAAASSYALYRGSIATGRWTFNHACLATALAAPGATDLQIPLLGRAYYYLVSGRNSAGEGILGRTSAGQLRPNDFPCP